MCFFKRNRQLPLTKYITCIKQFVLEILILYYNHINSTYEQFYRLLYWTIVITYLILKQICH